MRKREKIVTCVLGADQRAHQIVVIGSGSWARAATLRDAVKLWRSHAPRDARAADLQGLMVFDVRWLAQPSRDLPTNNWLDPSDENTAYVNIDGSGTISLRHAVAVRI